MPEDVKPAAPSADNGPHYNADVEELNSTDTIEESEETEDESTEEVEVEEAEEELEEIEAKTEEETKPDIPFNRPTVSTIKAKYPNFFKDFPEMRESYFREIEFTKIFPTVDDAKEAFEDNEAFSNLRESILNGQSQSLIDAVSDASDDKGVSLVVFGRNFLTDVHKKDPMLYSHIITPLFENMVRSVAISSDENERNAALVMSKWLFGTTEVAEGTKTFTSEVKVNKVSSKDDEASYNNHMQDAGNKANRALAVIIAEDELFKQQTKGLSNFAKNAAVKEIIDGIHSQLKVDPAHAAIMNSRWKRAKDRGYSDDEKAKIISTFLARAKHVIPTVRSKVLKEALGIQSKANNDRSDRLRKTVVKNREVHGSSQSSRTTNNSNGKVDYRKMSDMDILNSD